MRAINGAVAFVAGGSSGIGLAVSKALCARGARVAFSYRRHDHRDQALTECLAAGGQALAVRLDVTDRRAFEQAVDEIERSLGPIDIFCNSAGVSLFGAMENATYEDWDWVFGVNVGGTINGIAAVSPRMIRRGRGGHIVTIGSMAGFLAGPEAGVYSASKFAVRGIMECLRLSLAKHGIGVSLVSPGLVNSNINEAALGRPRELSDSGTPSDETSIAMAKNLLRMGASPEEVGASIIEGISRNDFHIFTHRGFWRDLDEVHTEIMKALPIAEPPPGQRRIEDRRRLNLHQALAMAASISGWGGDPCRAAGADALESP